MAVTISPRIFHIQKTLVKLWIFTGVSRRFIFHLISAKLEILQSLRGHMAAGDIEGTARSVASLHPTQQKVR